ncbi:MAG TPA: hypothetical protein VNT60_10310 [Deinococcales bacterium]|nr:hypothetical protein [Deinococcales bacterium]
MLNQDAADALTLAYQWELIAERSAGSASERVPGLDLSRMVTAAQRTRAALADLMQAARLPLPDDPGSNWQDSLVELSRGHAAVQDLERAAQLEPALRPVAEAVHAASEVHRECALEALTRIRPMS